MLHRPESADLSLPSLLAFVATCRLGSYTKAAGYLFLSQPAVHHQVRKLEAQLGVSLVFVNERQVLPTPAGEIVLQHAEELLDTAQAMQDRLRPFRRKSEISLAVYYQIGMGSVNGVIRAFCSAQQEHRLTVRSVSNEDTFSDLARGQFDFILTMAPYAPKNSVVEALPGVLVTFATSREHPLAVSRGIHSLADLAEFPFALTVKGSPWRTVIESWFVEANVDLTIGYEAQNSAQVAHVTLGSQQLISVLPIDILAEFGLVEIKTTGPRYENHPVVCYLESRRLSAVDLSFLAILRDVFAKRSPTSSPSKSLAT
jgi:DNA-binding transcriptional LysR family regulator